MSLSDSLSKRFTLNLKTLSEFDRRYPEAEAIALQKEISVIDVYRGKEFITSIDVKKHRSTSALYDSVKALTGQTANFN